VNAVLFVDGILTLQNVNVYYTNLCTTHTQPGITYVATFTKILS